MALQSESRGKNIEDCAEGFRSWVCKRHTSLLLALAGTQSHDPTSCKGGLESVVFMCAQEDIKHICSRELDVPLLPLP